MGKLRLFGYDWKVGEDKGSSHSYGRWDGKIINVATRDGDGDQALFHEITELCLLQTGARYTSQISDIIFYMDHLNFDVFSNLLLQSLKDNGLISEKKIRKLIEEK